MSTFLVATDFSKHADRALDHACALASVLGAGVEIFTSAYVPPYLLGAIATGLTPNWLQEGRDRASRQLDALGATLVARGVKVSSSSSTDEPSIAICARADEIGADLIATGTRGHTGVAHAVFGSVAERVARFAHSPVLTAHAESPGPGAYRRVLVPIDFSPDADLALAWARLLVEKTGGTLIVQHSCEMPALLSGSAEVARASIERSMEISAREKLEAVRQAMTGCDAETIVSHGRAEAAILEAAEGANADLIVMGTRGRTGMAHVLLGSTAARVLRRSHLPVVTLKTRPDPA